MKATVKTPDGVRTVPDWAKCHCVSDHRPNYIHPYPFALPSGDELWLCLNTYHQATTLLGIYKNLGGPPERRVAVQFNYFVRSLITMYWQQELEYRHENELYQGWVERRRPIVETEENDEIEAIFEKIKRTTADE